MHAWSSNFLYNDRGELYLHPLQEVYLEVTCLFGSRRAAVSVTATTFLTLVQGHISQQLFIPPLCLLNSVLGLYPEARAVIQLHRIMN